MSWAIARTLAVPYHGLAVFGGPARCPVGTNVPGQEMNAKTRVYEILAVASPKDRASRAFDLFTTPPCGKPLGP